MPKKKSNLPVNPSQKDYEHYNAVLLEEIRSQMNAVIETVEGSRETLGAKIEEARMELKQEIQITQMAVQSNSKDIQNIKKKLEEHDQRFEKLENKVEVLHNDVKEITHHLERVETKLDVVVEKVERHDEEITFLKSAVS